MKEKEDRVVLVLTANCDPLVDSADSHKHRLVDSVLRLDGLGNLA
jgi:hypothetical protein